MGFSTKEVKFKISRCHDKDLIEYLHQVIFPSDEFHEDDSIDWVITASSGQPVGFCMVSPTDEGQAVYMARAGVLPAFQGLGLHTRMIRCRERFARSHGFNDIITYTKIDNIQSSRNLQKAGYELYVPEDAYADPDCLYWKKSLKPR